MSKQPTLNPNLRSFWRKRARNKVLYGGRDSSKTWDAAGMAVYLASKYTIRFLCTRQFQNKIAESVYTTLCIQIKRFGLEDEYDIQAARITHLTTGSEFIFYGLWRNIDEIKSLEGIDICWIEEAHNLTKAQWEILEPTLRKENSEFWIIFNPRLLTDFVYQRFVVNPPKNTSVRKINYNENPFLSNTSLEVINAKFEEDKEAAKHIYLGEPKQDDNDSIIKRSWVLAAIDAHKRLGIEPVGARGIGFDVADGTDDVQGTNDTNATVSKHGCLLTSIVEWRAGEDEIYESSLKVYQLAKAENAYINYDSIGVGAGVGSNLKKINASTEGVNVQYYKFNAGERVKNPDKKYADTEVLNKDHFANLKAQSWWLIADRLKITYNAIEKGKAYNEEDIISIGSDVDYLDKLINELTQPKKDFDHLGRVKVESKKDLKKRGIASPNIADAFIMAYTNVKTVNPLLAAMQS